LRIVDLLLRHQAGARFRRLFQSGISGVAGGVRRLCPGEVSFRTPNFLFGAPHASIRAGELRGQLGDFQDRERLLAFTWSPTST
jgi:hypothetical protein